MSSVFDGMNINDSEIKQRLAELEKSSEKSNVSTLDFQTIEWLTLKNDLHAIDSDFSRENTKHTSQKRTKESDSAIIEMPKFEIISMEYSSSKKFIETVEPIIIEKTLDKKLPEANKLDSNFKELKKLLSDSNSANDDMVTYYLQFMPNSNELKTKTTSKLAELFEKLVQIIKGIFRVAKNSLVEVWKVIKNPDDYYTNLRGKVANYIKDNPNHEWARYVFFAPDLFRLYFRLMLDERVPQATKLKFLAVIGYLISPLDLIPEGLVGPAGYFEDTYLLTMMILELISAKYVSEDVVLEHWIGEKDEIFSLMEVASKLSESINFFKHIKNWVNKQVSTTAV